MSPDLSLDLSLVMRLVLRVVVWHALCAHAEPAGQVVSLSFGKPRRFSQPGLGRLPRQGGGSHTHRVALTLPRPPTVSSLATPSSYSDPLLYLRPLPTCGLPPCVGNRSVRLRMRLRSRAS